MSSDEAIRLFEEPPADPLPTALGVLWIACVCPHGSAEVWERVRTVLAVVFQADVENWPSVSEWSTRLPAWFTATFAPERPKAEVEAWLKWWRGLSDDERAKASAATPWTPEEWVYCMKPERRFWRWWNGTVTGDTTLRVELAFFEWPFDWSALEWLLRASGAVSVEEDDGGDS